MLLTIITVTRNDSKRLIKTIESLKLFYENDLFEHIIIDGASSDDTQSIVKELIKKYRNIIFKSEGDKGIYDGMNKGISLSNGDFVLFLNSGDEMEIQPETLVSEIKKLNNKTLDIACFSYSQYWEDMKVIRHPISLEKEKMPTSHQAMLFSRVFLTKNTYNINYKIAADFDLYHQANSKKIKLIHDVRPLTLVEGEGFASNSTYKSYSEYIKIVFINYGLTNGSLSIVKIFAKLLLISIIKRITSKNLINKIRSLYYASK